MTGPLADLTVLDLTRALAGPHAAMMLGDLGARVIKVETPGHGDDTRGWGPPFVGPDRGPRSRRTSCPATATSSRSRSTSSPTTGETALTELIRRSDVLMRELPPRRARPARLSGGPADRAEPAAGGAVHLRVRPRRPRGRPGRLRPDRPGRGRPDVDDRPGPGHPHQGGSADRRPAGRDVRRLRRARRAARAGRTGKGGVVTDVAVGRGGRRARLPGHPLDGGRRGAEGRGPAPPVDLPVRAVPRRGRHGADLGRLGEPVAGSSPRRSGCRSTRPGSRPTPSGCATGRRSGPRSIGRSRQYDTGSCWRSSPRSGCPAAR